MSPQEKENLAWFLLTIGAAVLFLVLVFGGHKRK